MRDEFAAGVRGLRARSTPVLRASTRSAPNVVVAASRLGPPRSGRLLFICPVSARGRAARPRPIIRRARGGFFDGRPVAVVPLLAEIIAAATPIRPPDGAGRRRRRGGTHGPPTPCFAPFSLSPYFAALHPPPPHLLRLDAAAVVPPSGDFGHFGDRILCETANSRGIRGRERESRSPSPAPLRSPRRRVPP